MLTIVRTLLTRRGATLLAMLAMLSVISGSVPAAIAAQTAPTAEEEAEVTVTERIGGAGGSNVVTVVNQTDGRLRIRGNVDLNRIPGDRVAPGNHATAYASCTDCQTFSVALQINLVQRHAGIVAPENTAVALNFHCAYCVTVAHAIQYLVPVDDPSQTPPEVTALVRAMDQELREVAALARSGRIDVVAVQGRVNGVLDQFRALGMRLDEQHDEATEETTPAP
jgi:hypothetical protein